MNKTSFGLDRIRVEHKALEPRDPFFVTLPPPISVNAMYGQAPGRKRFHTTAYANWIEDAGRILNAARPPKFPGQVWIGIQVSHSSKLDIDNAAKGILDLLVKQGVIKDDRKKYLQELRLTWGNNSGARVEVRPFPFEQARAA